MVIDVKACSGCNRIEAQVFNLAKLTHCRKCNKTLYRLMRDVFKRWNRAKPKKAPLVSILDVRPKLSKAEKTQILLEMEAEGK